MFMSIQVASKAVLAMKSGGGGELNRAPLDIGGSCGVQVCVYHGASTVALVCEDSGGE